MDIEMDMEMDRTLSVQAPWAAGRCLHGVRVITLLYTQVAGAAAPWIAFRARLADEGVNLS